MAVGIEDISDARGAVTIGKLRTNSLISISVQSISLIMEACHFIEILMFCNFTKGEEPSCDDIVYALSWHLLYHPLVHTSAEVAQPG